MSVRVQISKLLDNFLQAVLVTSFKTFQILQTMLAIHDLPFRFFFEKKIICKNLIFEPSCYVTQRFKNIDAMLCHKKCVIEKRRLARTLLIGSIPYLLMVHMTILFNKLPRVNWEYSADDGDGMSKTIITTACTNLLLYE